MIPQAIGGALHPTNPFKTDSVCRRCNNLCGLFVDTAFIKSWFTQAARSQHARRHLRLDDQCLLPLSYMGAIRELDHEDRNCEFWSGPTGDSIFHFHLPYAEVADMPLLVGPAPTQRDAADPGFAFLFVVASNSAWHPVIFRSFVNQFKGSQLFLGNGPCPGGPFSEIPPEMQALHSRVLQAVRHQWLPITMGLTVNYEARFLAKLALGIGHLFLNPTFASSGAAVSLRNLMWGRTSDQRAAAGVRGAGFFNGEVPDAGISWEHGHLLCLLPNNHGLALHARFYNSQTATIYITHDESHWQDRVPNNGMVFALAPSVRKFSGPMTVYEFASHRLGALRNEHLSALEDEVRNLPPLPPVHLPVT